MNFWNNNFERLFYNEQERDEEYALIAQLGERQTEDLKVLCSIHSQGIYFSWIWSFSRIFIPRIFDFEEDFFLFWPASQLKDRFNKTFVLSWGGSSSLPITGEQSLKDPPPHFCPP